MWQLSCTTIVSVESSGTIYKVKNGWICREFKYKKMRWGMKESVYIIEGNPVGWIVTWWRWARITTKGPVVHARGWLRNKSRDNLTFTSMAIKCAKIFWDWYLRQFHVLLSSRSFCIFFQCWVERWTHGHGLKKQRRWCCRKLSVAVIIKHHQQFMGRLFPRFTATTPVHCQLWHRKWHWLPSLMIK